MLRVTNEGSTIALKLDMQSDPKKTVFQRLYICFDAIKNGWKAGCRPIIAWAVVHMETKITWSWFLQLLIEDLSLGDGTGITLMSDMQKGLIPSIAELLPNCEHRMCARHIYAAWQKKWKGAALKKQFWRCVASTYLEDLVLQLQKLDGLVKT
ncbi:hypothetical protein LINPERHAP1_LOCUS36796, partial [Linum perenne]